MKKSLLILALVVIGLAASVIAASAATRWPILGPKAYPYLKYTGLKGTKGFGQVKPHEIYYGGDPTGLVCHIHWNSWGGRVARGTGIGWYVGPRQSVNEGHSTAVNITASRLGTWHGRAAYNHLDWSFPHPHERFSQFC